MKDTNAIYDIFVALFKKYYPNFYTQPLNPNIILEARKWRFANDPYWKIWKQYGVFVGFVEAFFHRQEGDNQLPKLFEKYPQERKHFSDAGAFIKRFPNEASFLEILEASRILRMRHQNAHHIHTAAQKVATHYNNEVPSDKIILSSFKGYGPKITNMVLNVVFDQAEIAIDVRVFRAAIRLGLTDFEPKDFKKDACKKACENILLSSIPSLFLIEADYLLFMEGSKEGSKM